MPKEAERPTRFAVDVSKRASKCNKCRSPIEKGTVRMAKIIPNYFYKGEGEVPDMKQYHHINCLFEVLYKARATTKVIDDVDDIEGWDEIDDEHKQTITSLVEDLQEHRKKLAEDGSPKKPQRKRKAKSEEDDESGEESADEKKKSTKKGSEKGSSGDEKEGDENSHPQKPPAKKAKKDVKSSAKKGKDKSTKKAVDKKKKVVESSDDESDADSFIGDEEMDSGGEESEEEEELDELSDEDESELDSSVLDESSSDEDNSSDESSGDEDGYAAATKQGPSTSRTSSRPQRRKNKAGSQGDGGDSKKARVPCKYGESCYRKNAQHKADFWHPNEDEEKKGKAKADKQNGQQDEQDNE